MTRAAVAEAWAGEYEGRKPSERQVEMGRLYVEEGLTYREIAERYGISRQRVAQLLEPFGFPRHWGRRRQLERARTLEAVHERVRSGETSLRDEWEALGYASEDSLRNALLSLGLHFERHAPHGVRWRYNRGCRCELCKVAHREYMRSLRRSEPRTHGTASAYTNYGCRCAECREAVRVYRRELAARQRRKKEAVV